MRKVAAFNSARAFDICADLVGRVRRPRKTGIRNEKFSCLVVCHCGRPALLHGEVEYPMFGGLCEACSKPLPHITVLTRAHASELTHLEPTLAGQTLARNRRTLTSDSSDPTHTPCPEVG